MECGEALVLSTSGMAFRILQLGSRLMLASMFVLWAGTARAQEDEGAVRAAYLFNLSKYVSWPSATGELKVCSEADPRTGQLLKQILDGKKSEGRVVHVVLNPTGIEQRQCSILYLSGVPAAKTSRILQDLGGAPVLTVSDNLRFVRRGGMVSLVRAEDQIQLHVNLSAVRSAEIQISSRLLSIAVIEHSGEQN